jgi:hypothetical protein
VLSFTLRLRNVLLSPCCIVYLLTLLFQAIEVVNRPGFLREAYL